MGVPLVLRWLWWRVSALTEVVAIACSTVLAPLLVVTVDDEGTRLLVVFVVSCFATLATALAGPRAPDATTIAFCRRVRPPGAWGPRRAHVATTPGSRSRGSGGACSPSSRPQRATFCTLVGLGTRWFDGTAPAEIARPVWITSVLAAALVSAIFAWRAVARLDVADAT